MAMTAETLLAHPGLRASLRQQASLLAQAYDANPRVGTVFATQQRWLMAHIGLALSFRAGTPGRPGSVSNSQFFDVVALHDVAATPPTPSSRRWRSTAMCAPSPIPPTGAAVRSSRPT
jgi:hypothetical protein